MEVQGEWWLPEAPDEKLQGTLVIDEGKIELSLFGKLTHRVADPIPGVLRDGEPVPKPGTEAGGEPGVYPRFHGDAGNKAYTLEDCFQIERTGIFGGQVSQRITVHQVFEGVWFPRDDLIAFTEVVVEMAGMAEFVQRSGLSEETKSEDVEEGSRLVEASIKLEPFKPVDFAGLNGSKCQLLHIWRVGGTPYRERHITETVALRMTYNEVQPVEVLLRAVAHVQDLVSVATARRAAFTKVVFRRPDLVLEPVPGRERKLSVTLYTNWVVKPEAGKRPVKWSDVIFNLDEFGGIDTLTSWLKVADTYAAALGRVMISRYSDAVYTSDLLLSAAAAVEGYHRDKYEGGRDTNTNLVDRIEKCIDHAGPIFDDLVSDTKTFAKLLKKGRVAVAHHLDGVEGSAQQLFLGRAAAWLLTLCLFRDAGAPDAVFARILERQDWRWLKGHVKQVLEEAAAAGK